MDACAKEGTDGQLVQPQLTVEADCAVESSELEVEPSIMSEAAVEVHVTVDSCDVDDQQSDGVIYACRLCNRFSCQEVDILKHLFLTHNRVLVKDSLECDDLILTLQPLHSSDLKINDKLHESSRGKDDENDQLSSFDVVQVVLDDDTTDKSNRPAEDDCEIRNEVKKKNHPKRLRQSKDVHSTYLKVKGKLPARGLDGLYRCIRCKRSFGKERQFNNHLCFAPDWNNVCDENNDVVADECDANYREAHDTCLKSSTRLKNAALEQEEERLQNAEDLSATTISKQRLVSRSLGQFKTSRKASSTVNMSHVDHLFTEHVISQETESDKRRSNELFLFSCNVCKKVFKTLNQVRAHCFVHTNLKPFKCPKCNYVSNSKSSLWTHMQKHANTSYRYSQLDRRTRLVEHKTVHSVDAKHRCRVCGCRYGTPRSLFGHIRKKHADTQDGREYLRTVARASGTLLYQCHVCRRKFKKRGDRDRHLCIHDVENSACGFKCELCSYTTGRPSYLEKHFRRRHHLIFCCFDCSEKFLSAVFLKRHLEETHLRGKPLGGNLNAKLLFRQSLNCSWYLPEIGPVNNQDVPILDKLECAAADGDVKCPTEVLHGNDEQTATSEPEAIALSLPYLIERLKYKQLSEELYDAIRQTFGSEECEHCGRHFHLKADLKMHKYTHKEEHQFKCQICSYSSKTNDNLKRHVESAHERRRFVCEECGHVSHSHTASWRHAKSHTRTSDHKGGSQVTASIQNAAPVETHRDKDSGVADSASGHRTVRGFGKQPHKCPHCDQVFHRSLTDLKKHLWIHEGVKPYKCSLCSYACRSQNNLNVHMSRHSTERPYSCAECGKAYKSKSALKWHEKSHLSDCQFRCHHCEYVTSHKVNYKRHQEVHNVNKLLLKNSRNPPPSGLQSSKKRRLTNSSEPPTPEEPSACPNDSRKFQCFDCDRVFDDLPDTKHHLHTVHHLSDHDIDGLKLTELFSLPVDDDSALGARWIVENENAAVTCVMDPLAHAMVEGILVEAEPSIQMETSPEEEVIAVQDIGATAVVSKDAPNVSVDQQEVSCPYVIQYVTHIPFESGDKLG